MSMHAFGQPPQAEATTAAALRWHPRQRRQRLLGSVLRPQRGVHTAHNGGQDAHGVAHVGQAAKLVLRMVRAAQPEAGQLHVCGSRARASGWTQTHRAAARERRRTKASCLEVSHQRQAAADGVRVGPAQHLLRGLHQCCAARHGDGQCSAPPSTRTIASAPSHRGGQASPACTRCPS